MKKHLIWPLLNFAANVLLIAAILIVIYGLGWEYSTRQYLKGFSDAVIPFSSPPDVKAAAILAWMDHGPARQTEDSADEVEFNNPEDTLNYDELLRVCGTGTNAFVNLATGAGMKTRRLLLLDSRGQNTNHVVAEVLVDGRWIVVDPSFHVILRDSDGHYLTRQQLAQPATLRDATKDLPNYDLHYNYENVAYIHLTRLPLIGSFLSRMLDTVFPNWQESIDWTLLLERESYGVVIIGVGLLLFGILARYLIDWYVPARMSIATMGTWQQLREGGFALFVIPLPERFMEEPAIVSQESTGAASMRDESRVVISKSA